MKPLLILIAIAALTFNNFAYAAGCAKGPAQGPFPGHAKDHHAAPGAIAGCPVKKNITKEKISKAKPAVQDQPEKPKLKIHEY